MLPEIPRRKPVDEHRWLRMRREQARAQARSRILNRLLRGW
ncbi:MAG TPA: hypothetical protein VFC00_30925 [Micromonosporaceae bacterium]|nr:hypothetical protein [Micromonosporaceae bacterium]